MIYNVSPEEFLRYTPPPQSSDNPFSSYPVYIAGLSLPSPEIANLCEQEAILPNPTQRSVADADR